MTSDERTGPPSATAPPGGGPSFTGLPDQRENLITPGRAQFSKEDFGHKGKVYDGWETRRRREPGHDHAVVRLGVPGIVHGVVVDTSWFTGNFPPRASVEATALEGHPSVPELEAAEWVPLVGVSDLMGDADNPFSVADRRRFTHVRLSIYPDGGVARFRVHGRPVPDPRLLTGTVDLAALEHGGDVVDCSNMFYSSPTQLLLPGRSRSMGEGWENARRRDDGNDHVIVRLGARGRVRRVEVDTSYFVGNAPGWASVRGSDAPGSEVGSAFAARTEHAGEGPDAPWTDLVPRTRLQPDTRHLFRVAGGPPVTHVRLDVFPDGGVARLRVHGEIAHDDLGTLTRAWLESLPDTHLRSVLTTGAGLSPQQVGALVARRPLTSPGVVDDDLVAALLTP
jgi:allantoicase